MKKLAIIYDWIDKWGGAEKILEIVFNQYPHADIYTLYCDTKNAPWARPNFARIKTSFLQNLYKWLPNKQYLSPFMPSAIESFDLSEYERVLSITSSFAKGVITRPETKHISYVFAPTRFLWHEKSEYNFMKQTLVQPVVNYLKKWDQIAINRPDKLLTLSEHTQKLIKNVYKKNAEILYPPFDESRYEKIKHKTKKPLQELPHKFFLFVGRLEPYKKLDILIDVFAQRADWNLVVVGTGSMENQLRRRAVKKQNILFTGFIPEAELAYIYQRSYALIMPQSEDFGYTALEALAFGIPVISFRVSATAELVANGQNGILFSEQSSDSLTRALEKFHTFSYNVDTSILKKFSKEVFLQKLHTYLEL